MAEQAKPGVIESVQEKLSTANDVVEAMNNAKYVEVNLGDSMVGNPRVLAEKILKNSCTTCSLTVPVRDYSKQGSVGYTVTIPFYMDADFSTGLSVKWESYWGDIGGVFTQFANAGHAVFGHGEAQVSGQSALTETKYYKGSDFDGFNISCLFLCTNRSYNTIQILKILSATTLPTMLKQQRGVAGDAADAFQKLPETLGSMATNVGSSLSSWTGFGSGLANLVGKGITSLGEGFNALQPYADDLGMVAPLNFGYTKRDDDTDTMLHPNPNSTVTLSVGDYFRADELLVTNLSNITLSKEVIAPASYSIGEQLSNIGRSADLYKPNPSGSGYGFPLYLKCSLKLVPCGPMHYTKFQKYFNQRSGGVAGNLLQAGINALNSFVLPS